MNIITVINQKGGVGKSTTTHALGSGLQLQGYKVLFIDLDAQGNLSYALNAQNRSITSLEVLSHTSTAKDAILATEEANVIPSSPSLAGADALLTGTGREYRLKEALEPIKNDYDFIIMDTPPSLGILSINALTASTGAVIPAQADIFSLQGIGQLNETIATIKKYTNPNIEILGILITRYNNRTILTKDLTSTMEEMANQLNTKVYKSRIREAIAVKEAQAMQESLFSYAPRAKATDDYKGFIKEFIEGLDKK